MTESKKLLEAARCGLSDAASDLFLMADTEEQQNDYAAFMLYLVDVLRTFTKRSSHHDVWKHDGLDYRACMAYVAGKHNRLKVAVWDAPLGDVDVTAAFEHIRDDINYELFLTRRLECEVGPIDWDRLNKK